MSSWILIPSVLVPLIIVGAVASRFLGASNKRGYTGKYDPKTGLGRGAPGFQTGVKRVAVTPEIAARMRAGEQVSAEEIEAAMAKAQSANQASSTAIRNPNVDQDWLPQGASGGRSPAGKKNKRR